MQERVRTRLVIVSVIITLTTLTGRCQATAIVIAAGRNAILIGSDSKVVVYRPGGDPSVDTTCKVFQGGDHLFVATGTQSFPVEFNAGSRISVPDVAKEVCKPAMTVKECAEAFEEHILPAVRRMVASFRAADFDFYTSVIERKGFLDVVFFNFVGGEGFVSSRGLDAIEDGRGGFSIVRDPLDFRSTRDLKPGENTVMIYLGTRSAMMDRFGKLTSESGKSFSLAELVQAQIDETPDRVGPPVVVLSVDGKGARWVQSSAICESVELGSKVPIEKDAFP